jgi:hypothetical protein
MSVEHFPSTHRTWIEEELARGDVGLVAVRTHVMMRSRAALVAYVQGARVSVLGEADDIVHDFFARRFGEEDYLARWLASGLSLRKWLMHGVSAHIRELWRRRARDARSSSMMLDESHVDASALDAERAFDRMWVRTTLGEACRRVEAGLAEEGAQGDVETRLDAWSIFRQHVLEGRSYRAIRLSAGLSPSRESEEQLAVATRRVVRRVRAELRKILREDGIRESELDREVERLTDGFDA